MGVDEMFRRVREAYQFMDIATGRSTLRLFSESGVVTGAEIGDRLHGELTIRNDRHHRMVCRIRNGASNLKPRYPSEFLDTLVQELGFTPAPEHFSISGVYARCLKIECVRRTTTWG